MRILTSLIVGLSLLQATQATGAEISSQDLGENTSLIAVIGEITTGDSEKFRLEAAKAPNAVVALESPGGSTLEAIEIGETIRIRGFSTLVINGSECVSACALIWLAGTPRTLTKSSRVGFHATYRDQGGKIFESGVGNALVGRYLAILNLSQRAIVFATSASPSDMSWLSPANSSMVGIEAKIIDDFAGDNSSKRPGSDSPPPITTYRTEKVRETTVWANAGDWAVVVDHTLGDSCFAIRSFDDGTFFRLGLDLRFGNKTYLMLSNSEWTSLEVGQEYPLTIRFDDFEPWSAPMTAMDLNGTTALYIKIEDTSFWSDFSTALHLSLLRNDRVFARMSLGQSADASKKVVDCQRAANKVRSQRDPFAH